MDDLARRVASLPARLSTPGSASGTEKNHSNAGLREGNLGVRARECQLGIASRMLDARREPLRRNQDRYGSNSDVSALQPDVCFAPNERTSLLTRIVP